MDQTFPDFEVVIVNDGSTDRSVEIVSAFSDSRIRIITQVNKGISAARNRGISEASGKWILFLDADDILLPDALEKLVEKIIDSWTIVAGNYIYKADYREEKCLKISSPKLYYTPSEIYRAWLLEKINLRAGSCIINKDSLKNIRFNDALSRYEDFDFWFRCIDVSKLFIIPDTVMIYRESFSTARAANLKNWNKDYLFHINFSNECFWKKCVLGEFINYTYKLYPQKVKDIKKKYSTSWIYVRVGWLFRLYKAIRKGTIIDSLKIRIQNLS